MQRYVILSILLILSTLNAEYIRDNDKEIVTDTSTNLMWQDDSDMQSLKTHWSDAITYCEDLTLGGYTDWHLPNYNELFCLLDLNQSKPAIDPVFQNTQVALYWTSTTETLNPSCAWIISFYYGGDIYAEGAKTGHHTFAVRCVRSNTPPAITWADILLNTTTGLKPGDQIKAIYTYEDMENDPEGESRIQWFRDDGSPIPGATDIYYTLTEEDFQGNVKVGSGGAYKYVNIWYEITPVAQTGAKIGKTVVSDKTRLHVE